MKNWIKAFRLRTLPLALSCIIMGNGLAYGTGENFQWVIFTLAITTTLFLQILSNLANDLGDYSHGVDNQNRIGPRRTLQSGLISRLQMIKAIIIISIISAISGLLLIGVGIDFKNWPEIIIFALLGLSAMAAAIKYTMGNNPYGYTGFGDIAVFLFFGWLGVGGSYYLQTHVLNWIIILPASAMGMFSAAVLNINNMRDHQSDKLAGKNTVVVRFGLRAAKIYHLLINLLPFFLCVLFSLNFHSQINILNYLYLISFPLILKNSLEILNRNDFEAFDPYLKKQALYTFVFSILFVFSLNF